LPCEYQTSEDLIKGLRSIGKLTPKEKRELAKAIGEDFDAAVITNLSETERLRAVSATFTTCWLLDAIDRAEQPEMPDLRNADGDELLQCMVSYPLADGTADDDVRAALDSCADLRPATATQWNWVRREKRAAASAARARPPKSLTIESPRAAVKTASGRAKVADWLKMMENRTARAGESNSAMASYSFDWMWTELGIAELRR